MNTSSQRSEESRRTGHRVGGDIEDFCNQFRLDPVRVRFGNNASSTPVPELGKFFYRVVFEEWVDFEKEAKATMMAIQRTVPPEDLSDSLLFAEAARKEINPSPLREEMLSYIPELYYAGSWTDVVDESGVTVEKRTVDEGKPVFPDETSLLGIFTSMFSSVNSLVRYMCGSNLLSLRSGYLDSSEALTAAVLGVPRGASDSKTRKGRHVLPDGTLMKLPDSDNVTGVPICCFELKGAEKCITGRPNEPADCLIEARRGLSSNSIVELPSNNVPDSSKDLASRLGVLFRTRANSDNVDIGASATKPIAQALRYALSSKGGYAYASNLASGIAIKLERGNHPSKFIAKVALVRDSPVESVEHIVAMTHLSLQALRRTRKETCLEKDLKEMRDILNQPVVESEDEGNGGNSPGPSSKRGRDNTAEDDNQDSRQGKKPRTQQKERSVLETDHQSSHQSGVDSDATFSGLQPMKEAEPKEIHDVMNSLEHIIGTGKSGRVYRGVWMHRKVAVKTWNTDSEEGVLEFCKEIAMYRHIHKHHPDILGTAIPELFFFWNDLHSMTEISAKVGLVLSCVGQRIFAGGNSLCLEDGRNEATEISREDRKQILEAALSSLKKLHVARISHGDVDLRNLRVAKVPDGRAYFWKAWWIDLGQASIVKENERGILKFELQCCRSAFRLSQEASS